MLWLEICLLPDFGFAKFYIYLSQLSFMKGTIDFNLGKNYIKELKYETIGERIKIKYKSRKKGAEHKCPLLSVFLPMSFQKKQKEPDTPGKIMFVSEDGGFQALTIYFSFCLPGDLWAPSNRIF